MNTAVADALLKRIRNHEASVGIIGMGYVGLPLALALVERGFKVVGFDVDETKVRKLKLLGFMRFNPGQGWGGHCIPLDTQTWTTS